jgi:hypothetical protein
MLARSTAKVNGVNISKGLLVRLVNRLRPASKTARHSLTKGEKKKKKRGWGGSEL